VTLTRAPLQHWAANFFFLLEDVVARAVVVTPRFLEPPELEGGVVRIGCDVSPVSCLRTSSTTPGAPSLIMAATAEASPSGSSSAWTLRSECISTSCCSPRMSGMAPKGSRILGIMFMRWCMRLINAEEEEAEPEDKGSETVVSSIAVVAVVVVVVFLL
jgi:hypothetical protein